MELFVRTHESREKEARELTIRRITPEKIPLMMRAREKSETPGHVLCSKFPAEEMSVTQISLDCTLDGRT